MTLQSRLHVAVSPGRPIEGFLVYRQNDHAFDFVPADNVEVDGVVGKLGSTSLLFGTVQLEADVQTGRLLFVWGYSPTAGWRKAHIDPLPTVPVVARVLDLEMQAGVSLTLADDSQIRTLCDYTLTTVRVAMSNAVPDTALQIADGVNILMEGDALVGVELRPQFDLDGSV